MATSEGQASIDQQRQLHRMSMDPMQSPYNRSFNSMWPTTASGRSPAFVPAGWPTPMPAAEYHPLLQPKQFNQGGAAE